MCEQQRFLLTVAYDGANYSGWQRQANAFSIQQAMEEALARVFGQSIRTVASSRTDAGVHALGQRVAFNVATPIPLQKIQMVINNFLPNDIAVTEVKIVPPMFNPRLDAREKIYHYVIYNYPYPNPFTRDTSLFYPRRLDFKKMARAAGYFVGWHDFEAFRSQGTDYRSTVREIFACGLEKDTQRWAAINKSCDKPCGDETGAAYNGIITFYIRGNGFLYNMVRIMAGTLIAVGRGKIAPTDIPGIIASKDRSKAGETAPPQGLTLVEVKY
ncbi:MAG: tRNA pseudouridine(38-40) synthase TruA [Clostridiales bacterium]|jgi:tRNA pseudouridine38-40 synthase|nr:tRNA pseudouridine(38-40) synthase TruA [Clostridiales bacterium]